MKEKQNDQEESRMMTREECIQLFGADDTPNIPQEGLEEPEVIDDVRII